MWTDPLISRGTAPSKSGLDKIGLGCTDRVDPLAPGARGRPSFRGTLGPGYATVHNAPRTRGTAIHASAVSRAGVAPHRRGIHAFARVWRTLRTPPWIARVVFIVGAVTVLSALSPEIRQRTDLINDMVPPAFPAAATTGAGAVGLMLILVSRGLRRGKRRAWLFATTLTGLAVVLHLLKGLDVEEATLAAVLLVMLATSRSQFTARPDPRSVIRVAMVLLIGPLVATLTGWAWLAVDPASQAPGTTQADRIGQAFLGLFGVDGPVTFVDPSDRDGAS